jgi:nucleoside phosphorylase
MEGSGVADAAAANGVGYMIVRGITDYCGTHKNDIWRSYAAAVAAACCRAFLEVLPPLR